MKHKFGIQLTTGLQGYRFESQNKYHLIVRIPDFYKANPHDRMALKLVKQRNPKKKFNPEIIFSR